jgi:SAM domain (Sterile alpha motif)
MSKVREWLEAIGLAQYADGFESNDIDLDLLGQVDDQMLKDIGVSSAGHRLRIRNAIAKLSPVSPLAKKRMLRALQRSQKNKMSPSDAKSRSCSRT